MERRLFFLLQPAALFAVSGLTGEGVKEWGKWIMDNLQKLHTTKHSK